jgi:membrane associated rhomboid family serine protease
MSVVWALDLPKNAPDPWVLSWAKLAHGVVVPLAGYIFAHLNLLHLGMNALALLVLGGSLVACLGKPPLSWARFLYLFLGSGIAGGLAFILAHQDQSPVLGASGAIFGVLGALARVHPATGRLAPLRSNRTWQMAKFFVSNHAVLFAVAAIAAVLTGQLQSLAWEAHLGGLLFGFFAAPLFLDRSPADD